MRSSERRLSFAIVVIYSDKVVFALALCSGQNCTVPYRAVVFDELVERVELDHPEEVLAGVVPQHLEVLHTVAEPASPTETPLQDTIRSIKEVNTDEKL